MRTLIGAGTLAGVLVVSMLMGAVRSQEPPHGSKRPIMAADLERMKHELSNWGRWGKEDELGALNLISPAKRKQAAALVKEGISISLSRDADQQKAVDDPYPFERTMTGIGGDTLTTSS
jgi:hypothetical protein